jgi:nicotinate-nucleotide adenylyltransferase
VAAGEDQENRPIILCALEDEARALSRAGLDALARIVICGPGAEGIVRFGEREGSRARLVILAGLAGALRPGRLPGQSFLPATIVAESGRRFSTALATELIAREARGLSGQTRLRSATIASVDHVVKTVSEKRALAEKTSAELVDMESAMFAEAAGIFGWRWLIVKGVSDAHDEPLPRGIESWVDSSGATRTWRAIASLLARPWLIPAALRLRGQSRKAMQAVAESALHVLNAIAGERPDSRDVQKSAPESVLIFGGTFDPPHRGHVELPQHVARALGCQQILFLPAFANPLKPETPAPAAHRLEMLRLALRDCSNCSISKIEIERGGPSFTVETLERLRNEFLPAAHIRLLLGADAALEFHRWKEPKQILELATPAVVLRPPFSRERFAESLRAHWSEEGVQRWLGWIVDAPTMDISAKSLRDDIARGKIDQSKIDPRVLDYIREQRLYSGAADS